MPWPKTGATQYHAQLGLLDKGRASTFPWGMTRMINNSKFNLKLLKPSMLLMKIIKLIMTWL